MDMPNTTELSCGVDCEIEANATTDEVLEAIRKFERFSIPIVCSLGAVGNLLAAITFFHAPLRKLPCSLYLAVRAISDNGFLLSVLLTWVSSTFNLQLSQIHGVCQTIVYVTYVCGCISVWLCVFISFETYLLIEYPSRARKFSYDSLSKCCTCVLVVFAVFVYLVVTWVIDDNCSYDIQYTALVQMVVYTDTVLTLALPSVIILVLLVLIGSRVCRILRVRRSHKQGNVQTINPLVRMTPVVKVTKLLSIVSITFFFCNFPSYVLRHRVLIEAILYEKGKLPTTYMVIQSVFQVLYYLSFSINIIIYLRYCSQFKLIFKKLFYCTSCFTLKTPVLQSQPEVIDLIQRAHGISSNDVIKVNTGDIAA